MRLTKQQATLLAQGYLLAAADAIREMPPFLQASWAKYLLEVLDPGAGGDEAYRQVLEDIARSIAGRLESGEW